MFKTEISKLRQNRNFSIMLEDVALPNSPSVFFRAKQEEIFRQYETARLFMYETNKGDTGWDHWFQKSEDPELQKAFILLISEKFLEAAILFYNIIIDLSWVLTYVSAEYVGYIADSSIKYRKLMSIEEAYGLLRAAEANIENPNAQCNPFIYLKKMNPSFAEAIDLIVDFWKNYSQSEIRGLYNFIKHRGKPIFSEIEQIMVPKTMSLNISGKDCPTDVRDVQKSLSLYDTIEKLIDFDDNKLYPYISRLINILEPLVDPSPFVG